MLDATAPLRKHLAGRGDSRESEAFCVCSESKIKCISFSTHTHTHTHLPLFLPGCVFVQIEKLVPLPGLVPKILLFSLMFELLK